jgi:eukaryotic-like serine/threonine-protein kinase
MNGFTPLGVWRSIRRARLLRILAVYLTSAFVVLQAVDIFVDRLGLPDWFFPGAIVLLLIGLPIIVATALVQGTGPVAVEPEGHTGGEAETVAAGPEARARRASSPEAVGRRDSPGSDTPVGLADVAAVARQWLTWHRTLAGGVLAFLLLISAVAGYTVMRTLGIGPVGSLVAAGLIDERDRILVADFQSQTGDTLLAGVVTEAFRIDFAQSPVVRVIEPAHVRDVLRRMERDPAVRLNDELAREVALRDGIKAVVTGEIAAAGTGYVLAARLVASESGEVLAAFRETARDESAIIPTIDRLSKRLRERIGESLRTIRRNAPLEQVTTASLDALRTYTQAVHAADVTGEHPQAIALLEEAIALDPGFAMAYRKLGVILGNQGRQPARRIEASTRAYELRDRLTERERYLTIAQYHSGVTGDRDQAILAYRSLLSLSPEDPTALNNLGFQYSRQRDWARAEEHYRRAWAADNNVGNPLSNRAAVLYNLGRDSEARDVIEEFGARFPEHPTYYFIAAGIEAAQGTYDEATRLLAELARVRPDDASVQINIANRMSSYTQVHGMLADAARHDQEAVAWHQRQGTGPQGRLMAAIEEGFRDVMFRGAGDRAIERLDAALERDPLQSIDVQERPYDALGWLFADLEMPDRVSALIADFEAERGGERHRSTRVQGRALDAALAAAELRFGDLLAILPEIDDGPCSVCDLPVKARAHLRLGQADAAIAAWDEYLATPYIWRTWMDSYFLAEAYETLAELHDVRGDREKARLYYARFVELWRDADPELQPRVRAAQQRLERLVTEPTGS